MHLSNLWRQPNRCVSLTVLQTWLSPSWKTVSLSIGSVDISLWLNVTFRSYLGREISGNKSREFPDSVPFPLPVSWEGFRFPLGVTVRKIDSFWLEQMTREEFGEWYPETVSQDRENPFVVREFFPLFHKVGQLSSHWNVRTWQCRQWKGLAFITLWRKRQVWRRGTVESCQTS